LFSPVGTTGLTRRGLSDRVGKLIIHLHLIPLPHTGEGAILPQEILWEGVDWIHLAQDRYQ